jgi:potassium-transporting ATPase KdpC subunit
MKAIIKSLKAFLLFTIITGVIYPLFITLIGRTIFPARSNGSLIVSGGNISGSRLIGQNFTSPGYFSGRPSSTYYNPLPSGGSNYGLTSSVLRKLVSTRSTAFITRNGLDSLTLIPSEMLFASGSGLDPHISSEAAMLQVNRVSRERGFDVNRTEELIQLIKDLTEKPQLLYLGKDRINVLLLNLATDTVK